jgi:hypothetical protein
MRSSILFRLFAVVGIPILAKAQVDLRFFASTGCEQYVGEICEDIPSYTCCASDPRTSTFKFDSVDKIAEAGVVEAVIGYTNPLDPEEDPCDQSVGESTAGSFCVTAQDQLTGSIWTTVYGRRRMATRPVQYPSKAFYVEDGIRYEIRKMQKDGTTINPHYLHVATIAQDREAMAQWFKAHFDRKVDDAER